MPARSHSESHGARHDDNQQPARGNSRAIEDDVSGLLVEERDVEAMAEAMVRVANDTVVCARLGASAHRKARTLYSWPAERARLLTALERTR